jgi:hypothetical protein
MSYDSPKTIRRRQQRQNDAPKRRSRQRREIQVMTDEQWGKCCDFHLASIHAHAEAGLYDNVRRHARALVTMAVQRRACELIRDLDLRSVWKAMDIARHELLNVEVA